MSILILAVGDVGYGYLAREKRADLIIPFGHRLTTGPIPADGPPETFFRRQQAIYENDSLFHEAYWFEPENLEDGPIPFKRICQLSRQERRSPDRGRSRRVWRAMRMVRLTG